MLFVAWFFGLACGVAATLLVSQKRQRRREKPVTTPDSYHTYGHPFAPVKELRKLLPAAPTNYTWEVSVRHDAVGTPWLYCGLIDTITGSPADQKKVDLVRCRSIGGKNIWAAVYREYPSLRKDHFYNDLLGPVADWATSLAYKYGHAHAAGDYTIG